METKKALVHKWAPFLVVGFLLVLKPGPGVSAQGKTRDMHQLHPARARPGPELAYTFPLHYGTFADVEVGAVTLGAVQLEVTVFEDSSIKDRRIWVLVPGRVELLTEILDVDNLFEFGSPLLIRMTASGPVSATLVRD
jgi:hypothetical protein